MCGDFKIYGNSWRSRSVKGLIMCAFIGCKVLLPVVVYDAKCDIYYSSSNNTFASTLTAKNSSWLVFSVNVCSSKRRSTAGSALYFVCVCVCFTGRTGR